MHGVYREVVPGERVVRTEIFDMPGAPPMAQQLATLATLRPRRRQHPAHAHAHLPVEAGARRRRRVGHGERRRRQLRRSRRAHRRRRGRLDGRGGLTAMPTKRPKSPASRGTARPPAAPRGTWRACSRSLKSSATRTRDELEPRYGITAARAFGVSMAKIQSLAKRVGRDHALARALWHTGWYDARLLAAFVADPAALTSSQMDEWSREFDNWAVVDTVCFKLFDQAATKLAFAKVDQWSKRDGPRDEFVKRAGLALLACLALHDKDSPDEAFASRLPLVERGAADDRNFVKKAASLGAESRGREERAAEGRGRRARRAARRIAAGVAGAVGGTGRDEGAEAVSGAAANPARSRRAPRQEAASRPPAPSSLSPCGRGQG